MLLSCLWLAGIVAVTLFPYDFGAAPSVLDQSLGRWSLHASRTEIVLNVLLFVPLGVLLCRQMTPLLEGWRVIAAVGATGLLVSGAIESLQMLLPRRDSSFIDLLSNGGGALAGAWLYQSWAPRLAMGVHRLRARASGRTVAATLAVYALMASIASGALQRETRLGDWSPEYPLLVGNERLGDRPWLGRLVAFEFVDAAMSLAAMRESATTGVLGLPGTRIMAFDFTDGPPFSDAAGHSPVLEWARSMVPSTTWRPGVRTSERSWLRTDASASVLAERLRVSNAFTLRIQLATDDEGQTGPARILSNSWDIGLRNFTLGQEGRDMIVRFRTPHNGLNGARPQVVVRDVFADTEEREVLVTYDGATLLAAVAGSGRVHRTDLTPGTALALTITSLDVEADELPILTRLYLVSLFVFPGASVGFLCRSHRQRIVAGGLFVVCFAVLLEFTLVTASGRHISWEALSWTAVIGAATVTIVAGASSQRTITVASKA